MTIYTFAWHATELGKGWYPAILESQQEMDLIEAAQTWFSDIRNFWIDGYSSRETWSFINFCDINTRD